MHLQPVFASVPSPGQRHERAAVRPWPVPAERQRAHRRPGRPRRVGGPLGLTPSAPDRGRSSAARRRRSGPGDGGDPPGGVDVVVVVCRGGCRGRRGAGRGRRRVSWSWSTGAGRRGRRAWSRRADGVPVSGLAGSASTSMGGCSGRSVDHRLEVGRRPGAMPGTIVMPSALSAAKRSAAALHAGRFGKMLVAVVASAARTSCRPRRRMQAW